MAAAIHEVHLSAYKSALEEHPELKSFDKKNQNRTNKVIDSITAQAETGSFSVHAAYLEAYGGVLEVSQDVAKLITDSKSDVWKDENLRSLVKIYFENTTKTLEFFNTVEEFVGKAENGQLIIQSAVAQFDKESHAGGNKKNKYEKTLEKMKKFKDMEHYFHIEKFKTEFELVIKEHESLLEEVSKLKKKIEEQESLLEEDRHIQESKKVSNVVYCAVIGSLTLLTVGGLGIAAVAHEIVSAQAIRLEWEETLKKLDNIKQLKDILNAVDEGELINKEATKTILSLVQELITKISSILETVDFAIEAKEEETTEASMHRVKKKVDGFTEKIIEVAENVDKNRKLVIEARNEILAKIEGSM